MWSKGLLTFRNRSKSEVLGGGRVISRDKLVEVWERQKKTPWLIPREEHYSLAFFQKLYARLLAMRGVWADPDGADRGVPLRDMQRCMARVLRLTGAERGFDARKYDLRGDGTAGWWEFCLVWQKEKVCVHYSLAERIFLTLEDAQGSRLGRLCSFVVLLAILVSAGSFIVSTLPDLQTQSCPRCEPEAHAAFEWVDTVCVVLFTVEYLLRLVTAAATRMEVINQDELARCACSEELLRVLSWPRRAWQFASSWPSLIDLVAILPTYVSWMLPKRQAGEEGGGDSTVVFLKLTRLMRVVRAFRLGRRFEAVVIIAKAMKRSLHILWVLVLNLGLNMVVFGAVIYLFEQGEYDAATGEFRRPTKWVLSNSTGLWEREMRQSPFESIPHSFWWSLVTSTTVGYGDMYPTTDMGKVTAGAAAVWSLCVLALPVGVIGVNFQRVWEEYDAEKRMEREMLESAEKMEKQAKGALDPLSLSRRLLFEVYHDSGMGTSANDIFIGEAEIELKVEPDSQEPVSQCLLLALQENRQKSRRKISGDLFVEYTWMPHLPPQSGMELEGTLSVTVHGARNLVAVDWKGSGLSDPYVLLTLYPECPPDHGDQGLKPQQVQTKTIFDDPSPIWDETRSFVFHWHRKGVQALCELKRTISLTTAPGVMSQPLPLPLPADCGLQEPPMPPRSAEARRLLATLPRLHREARGLREQLPGLRLDAQRVRDAGKELLALLGPPGAAGALGPLTSRAGSFMMPGIVPEDCSMIKEWSADSSASMAPCSSNQATPSEDVSGRTVDSPGPAISGST